MNSRRGPSEVGTSEKLFISKSKENGYGKWREYDAEDTIRFYALRLHEVGPAIVFEHDPKALRLDHFLAQRGDRLGIDVRLDVMRQIAEVVRFAHQKKVAGRRRPAFDPGGSCSPHSTR